MTGGPRVRLGLNVSARNMDDIGIVSDRNNMGETGTKCYSQGPG